MITKQAKLSRKILQTQVVIIEKKVNDKAYKSRLQGNKL